VFKRDALVTLSLLLALPCHAELQVKLKSVYDGDTFKVDIEKLPDIFGRNISVRIAGIDTPEMKGALPCERDKAIDAKRLAESVLKSAKKLTLTNLARDKYFRILATVHADHQDLAKLLLSKNLARVYNGKTKLKMSWCD
jgi:endonuclease YncB( thermonuclease family)